MKKHSGGQFLTFQFSGRAGRVVAFTVLTSVLLLAMPLQIGCNNMIRRGQSPDEQLIKFNDAPNLNQKDTKYVASICNVWGLNYEKIEGVGLATGLDGTGSSPAPSGQRDFLMRNLENDKEVKSIKAAVESKNTSIVLLRALMPPGIKKGERFDIEVGVMTSPKTDSSSLEYGLVRPTQLQALELLGRTVRKGNITANATGRVLIDSLFKTRQDDPDQLHGIIPGGGVCTKDRKIGLKVRTPETAVRVTRAIAHAINRRFTAYTTDGREGVAKPTTDRIVHLQIPNEYKHNIGRFLQVAMHVAVEENSADLVTRLDRLDREVADPSTTQRAALELEAIGEEAVPTLRRALQHHDPEVKFYVAQALAYMDEADGVDILKAAALEEPAFRWHALTALASLKHVSARTALESLTNVESAETRYGAFRAMMARSPKDPLVRGQWLVDDFHFHIVPSTAAPMLHISRSKRPEIVLFGANQTVADNFLYVESGLTVQGIGNERLRITRYIPSEGEFTKTCSTDIYEMIETLTDVGVDYTTFIKMFRDASKAKTLNTRFVINAVPMIGRKPSMAQAGKLRPEVSERYVAEPMTTLFSDGADSVDEVSSSSDDSAEEATEIVEEMVTEPITTETRGGVLNKMKGLFGGR